ncbi:MAG: hypothetical protein AAGA69_08650 [Pseudomonadota bacterium]
MALIAVLTLLHVLVFVYWLGGDLWAFYTSRYLVNENVPDDRRLFAAKIVGDIDMAPRSALILTLPTGLALAEAKSWMDLGWPCLMAVIAASSLWLLVAWRIHLSHGGAPRGLKWLDYLIRWGVLISLVIIALTAFLGIITLPIFLAIKYLALAGCILCGLLIRRTLTPLFPALAALAEGRDTTTAQQTISRTLSKARPQVVMIWVLLLVTAFFGLWTPVTV